MSVQTPIDGIGVELNRGTITDVSASSWRTTTGSLLGTVSDINTTELTGRWLSLCAACRSSNWQSEISLSEAYPQRSQIRKQRRVYKEQGCFPNIQQRRPNHIGVTAGVRTFYGRDCPHSVFTEGDD